MSIAASLKNRTMSGAAVHVGHDAVEASRPEQHLVLNFPIAEIAGRTQTRLSYGRNFGIALSNGTGRRRSGDCCRQSRSLCSMTIDCRDGRNGIRTPQLQPSDHLKADRVTASTPMTQSQSVDFSPASASLMLPDRCDVFWPRSAGREKVLRHLAPFVSLVPSCRAGGCIRDRLDDRWLPRLGRTGSSAVTDP